MPYHFATTSNNVTLINIFLAHPLLQPFQILPRHGAQLPQAGVSEQPAGWRPPRGEVGHLRRHPQRHRLVVLPSALPQRRCRRRRGAEVLPLPARQLLTTMLGVALLVVGMAFSATTVISSPVLTQVVKYKDGNGAPIPNTRRVFDSLGDVIISLPAGI